MSPLDIARVNRIICFFGTSIRQVEGIDLLKELLKWYHNEGFGFSLAPKEAGGRRVTL